MSETRVAADALDLAPARPLLTIGGVRKSFAGRTVVDVDRLVVGEHPVEGLIGPNGAGKTTLMRLITGSLRAHSGTITLQRPDQAALPLTSLPPHRVARAGIVKTNQVITDFEGLTILDSLLLVLTPTRRERPWSLGSERRLMEERRDEMRELLDFFDLGDPRRLALSAGEKKLVDIVRCLLLKPAVLLLDEPTAGLTSEVTHRVMEAVSRLTATGTTAVIIEHDLEVIWTLCSRVTFMAEGRVELQDSPDRIREHPAVIASYLGQGHE